MLVPHGWNTGIGLAADLQIVAAAGNAKWVEYLTPDPYMDDVFEHPPKPDAEGFLTIPSGPGLGFRWSVAGIHRLSQGITIAESAI